MEPYQERVVKEREELNIKIGKLSDFIADPQFSTLVDVDEQERLKWQFICMSLYSTILHERIAAFAKGRDLTMWGHGH